MILGVKSNLHRTSAVEVRSCDGVGKCSLNGAEFRCHGGGCNSVSTSRLLAKPLASSRDSVGGARCRPISARSIRWVCR